MTTPVSGYDLGRVTGIGENYASIFDRFGNVRFADLPPMSPAAGWGVSSVRWQRVLGDISTATVVVATGGSHLPGSPCCSVLDQLHTWGQSLVIWRSGERVWEGPITRLTYRRDSVTIDACDVVAWLTKRVAHQRRLKTAQSVLDEGVLLLRRAIGDLSLDDLGVTVNSTAAATGDCNTVGRDLREGSGYYDDDLQQLCDAGLNFVAVGRAVVLWCDEYNIGQTVTLQVDNHLATDVDIIESGVDLSTRTTARNDQDEQAQSGPVNEDFYGTVEHLLTVEKVPDHASLSRVANRDRNRRNPAPLLVSIPEDTQLLPTAPFPIRTLVPGVVVPVQSFATCRHVQGTSTLGAVEVTQDTDGEKVGVSLVPISVGQVPVG